LKPFQGQSKGQLMTLQKTVRIGTVEAYIKEYINFRRVTKAESDRGGRRMEMRVNRYLKLAPFKLKLIFKVW
jgi:hypothetical protein